MPALPAPEASMTDTLEIIDALDRGERRVAAKVDGEWRVDEEA